MDPHGHLKISRKAYKSLEDGGDPFWNEKRVFSRWEAWEYMLQAAAYADHKWTEGAGSNVIDIARGRTRPLAITYLGAAWGWKPKRVRLFLEKLFEMDRIRAVGGARTGTVYLVVNYEFYQSVGSEKGTQKGTNGARTGHAEGTKEKLSKQENIGAGQKRGCRLPSTWEPKDSHRELSEQLGVFVDDEVEKFRDHHAARGTVFVDWDRGFNTWLRTAKRFAATATVGPKRRETPAVVWDEATMGRLR